MKNILIVVDMLNDFCHKGGTLFFPAAAKIIPAVCGRIGKAEADGWTIIHLTDSHDPDDLEFKRFPAHAVKGTWGAKAIEPFKYMKIDYTVEKKRYSGFYNTPLDTIIDLAMHDHGEINIEVVGVCTSICIMDTVGELANRDIPTSIYKNCVADFDEEAEKAALKRMESLYGTRIIL